MERGEGFNNLHNIDVELFRKSQNSPLQRHLNIPQSLSKQMSTNEKLKTVALNIGKVCLVLCLLYLFICSLDFLQASFRLISGRSIGGLMSNDLIQNPIVGLMIGILLTVLVQSSSTSSSIIVSMVSSNMLTVHVAIPMIMGANIGTSVTNTIVSLTQVGDREQFRRAFAGATVHDMFNWLAVILLLTIEIISGMLEAITTAIIDSLGDFGGNDAQEIKILKVLTEPFTKLVIQLDKDVIVGWGNPNDTTYDNFTSMVKTCWGTVEGCTTPLPLTTEDMSSTLATAFSTDVYDPILHICEKVAAFFKNIKTNLFNIHNSNSEVKCDFLFSMTAMSDAAIGAILLFSSLVLLCSCLIGVVKILNSAMKGIRNIIKESNVSDI
ncbi:unnamed protein product, partial [Meganyctiphanes norvegica]